MAGVTRPTAQRPATAAQPQSAIDAVRRDYDRLATDYDRRWSRYLDATLDPIVGDIATLEARRLLDVPCGTGELARRLRPRMPGLTLVGADLSPEMLRRASSKVSDRAAAWLLADMRRLPLADASFDVAACANGLHCVPEPAESLAELRRVLRPGGRLLLVDWCADFLVAKLRHLRLRGSDPSYVATYTLGQACEMLEKAGFVVEKAERFRAGWTWGMMRITAAVRPAT